MIQLSPSKLNLMNECKRCFWDANVAKIARPRGIFPSLPGGMDSALKAYFDEFRGNLPPEIEGKVPGVLFANQAKLKQWRNWRTGLTYEDNTLGVKLIGALDDCLIDGDVYMPFDYKTKGWVPKTDGSEYYQTQLDCYGLMLEANGHKTCGRAFLMYVWPESAQLGTDSEQMLINFGIQICELGCEPERAKETIREAIKLINGKRPAASPACEQCRYETLRRELSSTANGT